jgi:exopolysaccharide biosynthesis WecB/TagA/CpsF family protein
MTFSRISFLGLPLDIEGQVADIFEMIKGSPQHLVNIIGPGAWNIAREQPSYVEKLNQMSLVVPDGQGIALAAHLLTHQECGFYAFDMTGLAPAFFKKMIEDKTPVALVGGKPHDDEDTREKLTHAFQGLNIVATAHGYGDFANKIDAVLAKKPKVVIVSMESPRQEDFLLALRDAGYRGFAIGVGTFFERYASTKLDDYHRYPAWVDQYHLMPLYKIYKEPQRLWQRYLHAYKYFMTLAIKELVQQLTSKSERLIQQVTQK